MSALSLRGVRPWHGPDGLELDVAVGERALIRGPRGTLERLFRLVSGQTVPDEGHMTVLGSEHPGPEILSSRWARRISLARGEVHLVENLDLARNLTVPMVYALGIPQGRARELAMQTLEELELGSLAGRRPATVPPYVRQLVHLARSTTPTRELVVMLDPQRTLPQDDAMSLTARLLSRCRTAVILCSERWMDAPDGFRERTLGSA